MIFQSFHDGIHANSDSGMKQENGLHHRKVICYHPPLESFQQICNKEHTEIQALGAGRQIIEDWSTTGSVEYEDGHRSLPAVL